MKDLVTETNSHQDPFLKTGKEVTISTQKEKEKDCTQENGKLQEERKGKKNAYLGLVLFHRSAIAPAASSRGK